MFILGFEVNEFYIPVVFQKNYYFSLDSLSSSGSSSCRDSEQQYANYDITQLSIFICITSICPRILDFKKLCFQY